MCRSRAVFDVAGRLRPRRQFDIFVVEIIFEYILIFFLIISLRSGALFERCFVFGFNAVDDVVWVLLKIGAIPYRGLS